MLPTYTSAEEEKMLRHGHPNGSLYPFSDSRGKKADEDYRFQPRIHPTTRRRRLLLKRLALFLTLTASLVLIFSPHTRTVAFTLFPLSLFATEDFHLETVRYYDLTGMQGSSKGWERGERVLLCAPLRDAATHLPMFFSHLNNLTYPHNLIDLAFLVGDSSDSTLPLLSDLLAKLQEHENPQQRFGEISIIEKDFGQTVQQDVESRHGFAAQASRRKSMAQARNWLLSAALRPTHSWVYWRDVDVETAPKSILEDLMRHDRDVIVPNVWRPLPDWLGGEQPYDLNSWQESDTALALADTLDEDAVIVEGYAEYATWRPHLAYLRDPFGDPDMEMEIDGVGGVSILAKAKVFRSGVHFPAFSFEKHAETEGFGKMAKRMGYSVIGLPHYTIWHLYEPSVDDIHHMEEMASEKRKKEAEAKYKEEVAARIKDEFDDPAEQAKADRQGTTAEEEKEREEERLKRAKKKAEYEALKESKEEDIRNGEGADESVYGEGGVARKPQPIAQPQPDTNPNPPPLRMPPKPAGALGANGEAPARRMDG